MHLSPWNLLEQSTSCRAFRCSIVTAPTDKSVGFKGVQPHSDSRFRNSWDMNLRERAYLPPLALYRIQLPLIKERCLIVRDHYTTKTTESQQQKFSILPPFQITRLASYSPEVLHDAIKKAKGFIVQSLSQADTQF